MERAEKVVVQSILQADFVCDLMVELLKDVFVVRALFGVAVIPNQNSGWKCAIILS